MPRRRAALQEFLVVEQDRLVGLDRQDTTTGGGYGLKGVDSHGGDVKSHVLLGFGDLYDRDAARATELTRLGGCRDRCLRSPRRR